MLNINTVPVFPHKGGGYQGAPPPFLVWFSFDVVIRMSNLL